MIKRIICAFCIHLKGLERVNGKRVCKAFPNGIPDEVLYGKANHRKPYPGDNGIIFEPDKGFEYLKR